MLRRNSALAAALLVLADAGAPKIAAAAPVLDPKKVQAERNVLRFLNEAQGHRWILRHRGGRKLYPRLYDPRTQLVRNNTKVTCRRSQNPNRRGRYFCVVRPARHRKHEGLHVRYLRLGDKYFRIKWLYYQRRS
jgi:hypothetical protein